MKVSQRTGFFLASIGFLGGVFLQNIFFSFLPTCLFGGLFLLLTINFFTYKKIGRIYGSIFLMFFYVGAIWSANSTQNIENNTIFLKKYLLDTPVQIHYTLKEVYKQNPNNTDFLALITEIDGKTIQDKEIFGIIRIPGNYHFQMGDKIESKTKLYSIKNFSGGDIVSYFLSKGIYIKAYPYTFLNTGGEAPSTFVTSIHTIRTKALYLIYQMYPQESAHLLGGILLGARDGVSQDLNQNFNRSGLSHIIAVSGFNITILILFSRVLLFFLPEMLQLLGIGSITFIFVLLVGPSMSVVRAAIMGIVGYFVLFSGRKVDSIALLLSSLSIIVFFSPLSLNYDISLQLSFFATAGILFFSSFLKRILSPLPEIFFVKEALIITLAATLLNIPIILGNFGQISLVAPLTNVLVVWNISLIMFFGFCSLLFSSFFTLGALIFSYITYLFLQFDIAVVQYFGSQSWSVLPIDLGEWKWYFFGGYYAIILILFWIFRGE